MPDPYAVIDQQETALQERLAGVLELRAAEPEQRAMLDAYLNDLELSAGVRALEVGCGTGAVARVLAGRPGVAEVVGCDPSPVFVAKARELGAGVDRLSFDVADGRALPYGDGSFGLVVFHTVLCHVPSPEQALAEAFRVLRPGGLLAVFDGDYATTTLATGPHDPLQCCADVMMGAFVNDRWLVRRLPALLGAAGFRVVGVRSHGYLQVEPGYMLTVADRGADALAAAGRIGPELAAALKAEARRRAETGTFFGHIAYASLTARKPTEL